MAAARLIWSWRHIVLGVSALLPSACRTPAPLVTPPPPEANAGAGPQGVQVERIHEGLQVAPWELVFSAVRGEAVPPGAGAESVGIRNAGRVALDVRGAAITGPQATTFAIEGAPTFPVRIAAGSSMNLSIVFAPGANVEPGVHRATLKIVTGDEGEGSFVDLAGLVVAGTQPAQEPSLQQVVDALGFGIDVGSRDLLLGSAVRGEEVIVPRFSRAAPGVVSLYPVARFSSADRVPYGTYKPAPGRLALNQLGVIAAGQPRTLNPEPEPDGSTTFDPGDEPFGIYITAGNRQIHSEHERNTGALRHAARVFPLKTRGGKPADRAYLVAFDLGDADDFQDCALVLWNAKPAP
jgi:hypothetical protein